MYAARCADRKAEYQVEQRSVAPASYRWSVRVKFVDGVRLHPAKPVTQSTDNHHSFFSAKNSSSPPREGGWRPVSLHSAACLVTESESASAYDGLGRTTSCPLSAPSCSQPQTRQRRVLGSA